MTHKFVSRVFHCAIHKTFQRWLCYFAVVGAALLPAHSAQAQNANDPRLLRLLSLMQQRLNMAQDVARHKWNTRIPIDEPEPEDALLKKVAGLASQYDIEQRVAHDFFCAQIIASKIIQQDLLATWEQQAQEPFNKVIDQDTKTFQTVDLLTGELLAALVAAQPLLRDKIISVKSIDRAVADASLRPGIQKAVSQYAQAWDYAVGILYREVENL